MTEENVACTRSPIAMGVGGVDGPAEAALHAAGEGGGEHALARGVAVFLVVGQALHRRGDGWRDAEIHVGDPGGQHVSRANLCHLLVRRARNVGMSKSVAPVAMHCFSLFPRRHVAPPDRN